MNQTTSYDSLRAISEASELEKMWLSNVLPDFYRKFPLERCNELPDALIKWGEEWAKQSLPQSLYLYGCYGSGKTTFAFAVIRKLLQSKNIAGNIHFFPTYVTGNQIDSSLLKAIKHDQGDAYQLERYADADLLFIDDLDKVSATERFKLQMFEIVNRRMLNGKPTIITSNLSPKDLGHVLDGAVISRMSDMRRWAMIEFPKKDLRKSQVLSF